MFQLLWKRRATIILILVLTAAVFAGGSTDTEQDCLDEMANDRDWPLAIACGLLIGTGRSNVPAQSAQGAALAFEINLGQADAPFQYLAHSGGGGVYLAKGEAILDLRDAHQPAAHPLRATFLGGSENPEALPEEPLAGHVNYILGNRPEKWITDIPTYRRVRYRNVYPGIDVVYYGAEGALEHDVVVHPGANPAMVTMRFRGAEEVTLDAKGSALIRAGERTVEWRKPVLYQESGGHRIPVEGKYRRSSQGDLGFEVGLYDTRRPLIIDPVVTYASYQGRGTAEGGTHVAVDGQGNTYVSGFTRDGTFPITPGAFNPGTGLGSQGNGFIIKYNAANTAVVYSTYIGGALADGFTGMAIDASGNVYLTGATQSDDYPVTPGVLKTLLHKPGDQSLTRDCVVTKLSAAGNSLVYSTLLGGIGTDTCTGIAVDPQGNAYVTGATTESFGFPLGDNAPYRQIRGATDAFIVKLNPTATQVVYGTLLGGPDVDAGMAIAIDAQGAAYITGQSASFTFPVTNGVVQRAYAGTASGGPAHFGDAFVAKLSPDGGTFQYVTYLGGKGDEIGLGIAVDGQGNTYVTGSTTSDTFPTTAGAFQTTYKGLGGNAYFPGGDAFVTKLNSTATALIYSTYLGGSKDDWGTAIAVDSAGNAWVTGATLSTNFPITSDAAQKTNAGSNPIATSPTGDAWVAELNPGGSAMVYGTYLGGKGDDYALGIALDSSGTVYLTGSTLSSDFPTTATALQKGYGGTDYKTIPMGDIFLAKIGAQAPPPPPPPTPAVSVSSIASAASYAGGGVAPGEIVLLTGSGIGPKDLVTLTVVGGTKIGTQIGNTQVLFDDQAAPLVYVSGTQSSAIVPYSVSGHSSTQLVVAYNGNRSTALPVTVLPVHPALFSANASGRGQGAILNEDNSYNSAANPALKGHFVQLYATGEGQTNPAGVDGLLALVQYPKPVTPVTVTIGGQAADVAYYGAAPQAVAGLLQVNAKVPDNVPSGDVEVVIQIGTSKSQSGLIVAVR